MNVVVVNGVRILEFAVFGAVERRQFIFLGYIQMPPVVERFYFVHKQVQI